jgi:hypothetical protein
MSVIATWVAVIGSANAQANSRVFKSVICVFSPVRLLRQAEQNRREERILGTAFLYPGNQTKKRDALWAEFLLAAITDVAAQRGEVLELAATIPFGKPQQKTTGGLLDGDLGLAQMASDRALARADPLRNQNQTARARRTRPAMITSGPPRRKLPA